MTTEEALEQVEGYNTTCLPLGDHSKVKEATKEADVALSKQAVLKQLKGCLTGGEKEFQYVKIHIDSIPPVQASSLENWILVSEDLPKREGYYLVTDKSDKVCVLVFHKTRNSEEYWKRCAVAWKPTLLEPYKAEETAEVLEQELKECDVFDK